MIQLYELLIILYFCIRIKGAMEGFIVGGKYAIIEDHPYAAYLEIHCVGETNSTNYICGSSIINQYMTLTAAHCLENCFSNTKVTAVVGHEDKRKGKRHSAKKFILHEDYDTITSQNDIALVLLRRPLNLTKTVSRVALYATRSKLTQAYVVGWGMTEDNSKINGFKKSDALKSLDQDVMSYEECVKIIYELPVGTFCGSSSKGNGYVARGDSGSALVVDGYIQIGIVSYKIPDVSQSLIVYTDVSYFYNWIKQRAVDIFCAKI